MNKLEAILGKFVYHCGSCDSVLCSGVQTQLRQALKDNAKSCVIGKRQDCCEDHQSFNKDCYPCLVGLGWNRARQVMLDNIEKD